MSSDWKLVLYDYAKLRNEIAVQGNFGIMEQLVQDTGYLEREQHRAKLIAYEWRRRSAKPHKAQTRVKLMHAYESEDRVTANLRFVQSLLYEQLDERLEQSLVLQERIVLYKEQDGWRIIEITPVVLERQPSQSTDGAGTGSTEDDLAEASIITPRPLLNTYVLYGAQQPEVAGSSSRKAAYDRRRAVAYAEKYWNSANPNFLEFEVDCTNYVSQCLLAGGAPMNYTGRRAAGWWYQGRKGNREWWSYSWSVSNALSSHLTGSRSGLQAETVGSPYELDLGDVIIYDWDGDGVYQHSTIVTGFDMTGEPLVNAHTMNSRARLWSYRDSPAWTDRTRYRFFHISDFF